jgi:hypothetical protein
MPAATIVSAKANGPFIGSYVGSAAAQNIYIGFKPAFIKGWNRTAGDVVFYWSKASVTTYVKVVLAAATVSGAIAGVEDANGIGFSLPASANQTANEDGDTFDFIAYPE